MSNDVAGAWVGIYPDLSQFRSRLASELKAALAGVDGKVAIGTEISGLQRELAKLRSELASLGRTTATIGVDAGSAQAKIAAVKTELLNLGRSVNLARIGADALPFWAKIAELKTEFNAMSPLDIEVDANISQAMAKIATVRGELASVQLDSLMGRALGALGGGDSGGGGTNWGQLVSGALWGGGGMLGLAGFGSLGSFAGLGPEHLLMTAVGLGGSFVGAGLGAGLLGLGSLGKFGVGMGTDMAGIGQAAGDIKTVYGDWMNLNTAIQQYGRNSLQASQAQLQLNQDLRSFSPVARQAVFTAARTAYGWRSMFDKLTGPAERTGAQIINELIKRSEKFLPIVGKYAAENTKIIQRDLQPLLNWTTSKGGGIGIFTELEKLFQKGLPTDMQVLTRALELFAKTIAYTAPMTGKFMASLDRFLGKYDSGAGLHRWEHEINKLVSDFRVWWQLIKVLGRDLFDLFHADAGTAKAIVVDLTQMLQKLGQWERSTRGKAALHNLFEVHKQEILALLALIPPLVSVFGKLEFAIAPFATTMATDIVKGVDWLLKLNTLDIGKILAFGAGLGLILSHLKLMTPLLHGLGKIPGLGPILQKIPGIGKAFGGNVTELAANTGALGTNTDALIALTERMGFGGATGVGGGAAGDAAAATGFFSKMGWTASLPELLAGLGPIAAFAGTLALLDNIGQNGSTSRQFAAQLRNQGYSAAVARSLAGTHGYVGGRATGLLPNGQIANILPSSATARQAAENAKAVSSAIYSSLVQGASGAAGAVPQSMSSMISGLETQNTRLAKWAGDAQILLRRGVNPAIINEVARTAPQQLAVMARATTAELHQMAIQWEEQTLLAKAKTSGGIQGLVKSIESDIQSGVPVVQQAAKQLALAMDLPVPGIEGTWAGAMSRIAQDIGGTAAAAARLMTSASAGLAVHGGLYTGGIKHRAMGGPLMPGDTAVVGERGPELLQMGQGGSANVIPNHAIRFLASGTLPPGSQLAPTSLATQQQKSFQGLTQAQQALMSRAQGLLSTLQSIASSGLSPLQQLTQTLNATHERALHDLVERLRATHQVQLVALANQLVAANKAAEAALNRQLELNQLQALAQQTTDIAQAMATMTTDVSAKASDMAAGVAQKISDSSQAASDASAAKTKLIADQSQLWQDQYASKFAYGIAKQADLAKVALDQMTMKFDKEIGQAQQHADLVTKMQDALVSAAKVHLDQVQKTSDAKVARAQHAYDEAMKGSNAILQAKMQLALSRAEAEQQKEVARAQARVSAAEATRSTLTAQAQAGLQGIQAAAALSEQRQQSVIDKLNAQSAGAQGMQVVVNVNGDAKDPHALGQELMWEMRLEGVG